MIKSEDLEIKPFPEPWGSLLGLTKGVSILHKPSGTFVAVDQHRSQHANGVAAMKILETQLHALGAGHNPS